MTTKVLDIKLCDLCDYIKNLGLLLLSSKPSGNEGTHCGSFVVTSGDKLLRVWDKVEYRIDVCGVIGPYIEHL